MRGGSYSMEETDFIGWEQLKNFLLGISDEPPPLLQKRKVLGGGFNALS